MSTLSITPAMALSRATSMISANAHAHKDAERMARFGFEFRRVNSEHGHIAVVLDTNGHAQVLFELFLERSMKTEDGQGDKPSRKCHEGFRPDQKTEPWHRDGL